MRSVRDARLVFVVALTTVLVSIAPSARARSLHPIESTMAREFPAIALGPAATTFEPAERVANGRTVSGFRARFAASAIKTSGLSPVDAAMAQLAARDSDSGLRVLYPRFFDDVIVAEAGEQRVVLRTIGARSAAAQPTNGNLIYEGTYDSVDAIEVPGSDRSEELLLLRDDRAPRVYDYEIVEMSGVASVVLHNGAIRFVAPAREASVSQSASGRWEASTPSLEIERPWVVDANGRRSESAARWTLGEGVSPRTIRLTLSSGELSYPLVVDPTFSTTGSMGTARYKHTATLLPNGKVLFAGGVGNSGVLASAELYDPASGTFSATGPLGTARYYHTATLLPDGKVLFAGGYNNSGGYLASAELYDPASGTFSATGSLGTGRYGHTATLLPDGKVLFAGGAGSSDVLASAELYDPASGTFSATGSLGTARFLHTATLLPDGQVLIAGGYDPSSGVLDSAELYDPASGTFTATTGPLGTPREYHTATLLPNGKVLIADGYSESSGYLASAELYDPASGTFSATTGPLGTAHSYHTATLLPDGKVLFAGGYGSSGVLASAELYDPASGTFSATGSMGTARYYHTATLLPNGKVLIAGGYGISDYLASAELYDPASGTFSTTGSLSTARQSHTATLLPTGKVLIAGGQGSSGVLASAELYDPASGTFSATAPLGTARGGHTATLLLNGKVLVAGGYGSSSALASAELYDPVGGTFSSTGPLGTARGSHTATLLPNGKVLIASGSMNGNALASAEMYDPASGTFTATGPLGTARASAKATLLPNSKVLIVGGYNANGYLASAELYDLARGTFSATGPPGTVRYGHTATLLPNGKVLIAGGYDTNGGYLASAELYDPASGTFSTTGSLVTARGSQTATLLPNGKVLVAGGHGTVGFLSSAELYDPARGTFSTTGSLGTARQDASVTLLQDGTVLIACGWGSSQFLASAELYDTGDGFLDSRRPVILSAPSSLIQPAAITLSGSAFEGDSEASGSATNNSATNYPLLQLVRLDNEQMQFVLPGADWSATSFTSIPLVGLTSGYYRATIFTNAIPSISSIILILGPTITGTTPSTCLSTAGGDSVTLTGTDLLDGTVTVNGNPATVANTTATTIVFTTPAGTAGSVADVVVTTTGGTAATSYTYTTATTPTVTANGSTTFCSGGSVTLTSSSASGNQWYDGTTLLTGETNPTYVATTSGNYNVVVTTSGCPSAPSASTTVTVNPIPTTPTITPGSATTFCAGGSVTLTSSSASGNQWYDGTALLTSETNPTYVATTSGDYNVVVTTSGCASAPSASTTVTVNPIPVTPTITPGSTTTFCAGGSVTLTSSSASGNQWYDGTTLLNGETNPTYIATTSGNYNVVVTTSGCASAPSASTTVTVNPIPATPTITPGSATTFCAGGSVTLTSSSSSGNQWYDGTTLLTGETNPTYVATTSGDYNVVVTASGCASAPSASTTVTVNPIPAPVITATSCIPVGSTGLTASVADHAGNSYAWTLNGGTIVTGQGTSQLTYDPGPAGTLVTVSVTETSSSSCASPQVSKKLLVDFNDVPPSNAFHDYVCAIGRHEVTLGCAAGEYCPNNSVIRLQMAGFIARSMTGGDANVPTTGTVGSAPYNCSAGGNSLFADVAPTSFFCPHVHYIASQNVTLGCDATHFCPSDSVSRLQMALFLARALAGSDAAVPSAYTDPTTGRHYDIPGGDIHFTDMPASNPFSKQAHYIWARGVSDGCTPTTYCPNDLTSRLQMAKFLANAFNLQ